MDEYTRLVNKINEHLELPDVEISEDVISAYTLDAILRKRLESLKNETDDIDMSTLKHISRLANLIRKDYSPLKRYLLRHSFSKSIFKYPCDTVRPMIKNDREEIIFFFNNGIYFDHFSEYVTVCRDIGSDKLYFDGRPRKEVIDKYYDEILKTFTVLEEYKELFDGTFLNIDCGESNSQLFTNDFFDVEIIYEDSGKVKNKLWIDNNKADKTGISSRKWYDRETINDIIEKEKLELLKKIPINVADLEPLSNRIVKDALTKEKVLILR